ncbi:hypothetical protein CC80DRAFT_559371 [Byssothecium circinans]|uniref:Uncharacterized protein n=1 Tax=Byssothecium circinans TaxID=147558 RepID=A0A6A5UBD5_9PLEO|nr:hypothetical protein CC80DRAFT_559371 [Byssothecium circinans]
MVNGANVDVSRMDRPLDQDWDHAPPETGPRPHQASPQSTSTPHPRGKRAADTEAVAAMPSRPKLPALQIPQAAQQSPKNFSTHDDVSPLEPEPATLHRTPQTMRKENDLHTHPNKSPLDLSPEAQFRPRELPDTTKRQHIVWDSPIANATITRANTFMPYRYRQPRSESAKQRDFRKEHDRELDEYANAYHRLEAPDRVRKQVQMWKEKYPKALDRKPLPVVSSMDSSTPLYAACSGTSRWEQAGEKNTALENTEGRDRKDGRTRYPEFREDEERTGCCCCVMDLTGEYYQGEENERRALEEAPKFTVKRKPLPTKPLIHNTSSTNATPTTSSIPFTLNWNFPNPEPPTSPAPASPQTAPSPLPKCPEKIHRGTRPQPATIRPSLPKLQTIPWSQPPTTQGFPSRSEFDVSPLTPEDQNETKTTFKENNTEYAISPVISPRTFPGNEDFPTGNTVQDASPPIARSSAWETETLSSKKKTNQPGNALQIPGANAERDNKQPHFNESYREYSELLGEGALENDGDYGCKCVVM